MKKMGDDADGDNDDVAKGVQISRGAGGTGDWRLESYSPTVLDTECDSRLMYSVDWRLSAVGHSLQPTDELEIRDWTSCNHSATTITDQKGAVGSGL